MSTLPRGQRRPARRRRYAEFVPAAVARVIAVAQRAKKSVVQVPDVHLTGPPHRPPERSSRATPTTTVWSSPSWSWRSSSAATVGSSSAGSRPVGFGHVQLRRARFNTCEFDELEASTLDVAESSWSDVAVQGGRFGALAAPGARLTRVAMRSVRANYVNLRGAEITDLQLTGCRIEELDLGSAQVLRADLAGCDIDRLVLSEAVLKDVDLRGAELSTLEGVARPARSDDQPVSADPARPRLRRTARDPASSE